ncbi:MAG: stalk domain-containing protein [Eubacteriales bacterium]|nr:stalk domain-containing protein [Eubacteriales bacterium]
MSFVPTYATNISINNQKVQFTESSGTPFIDSANRTQVPFRQTLEAFGATVSWDKVNNMAVAVKDGVTVQVPIGASYIIKDGQQITNDTAALIKNGRTYLPIRAVLEAFGADVSWDSGTQTVVAVSSQSEKEYKKIVVDGGNMSGNREANVVVDIGFGDREYWAYTNDYGQLFRVTANKITLQDDATEPVTSDGRYYNDEAAVPGTELSNYDQGHVIADSLGGVSNAYNITPQDSTMNRHGDQAYMEKNIRDAGGCTNFEAIITYPNTTTQIPSHYHYTYTLNGNVITEDFDNVNPDEVNKTLSEPTQSPVSNESHDISSIDTNGNGQVSIAEAKAAGFKMPITKDHWLYKYMDDRDGDGMVGE